MHLSDCLWKRQLRSLNLKLFLLVSSIDPSAFFEILVRVSASFSMSTLKYHSCGPSSHVQVGDMYSAVAASFNSRVEATHVTQRVGSEHRFSTVLELTKLQHMYNRKTARQKYSISKASRFDRLRPKSFMTVQTVRPSAHSKVALNKFNQCHWSFLL